MRYQEYGDIQIVEGVPYLAHPDSAASEGRRTFHRDWGWPSSCNPTVTASSEASDLAFFFNFAAILVERGKHHPADAGLVWSKTFPREKCGIKHHGGWVWFELNAWQSFRRTLQHAKQSRVINLLPEPPECEAPGGGWFAPDADPHTWGTPYLAAGYVLAGGGPDSAGRIEAVWELRLAGLDGFVAASALWSRKRECERVQRQVLQWRETSAALMAQAAMMLPADKLTDSRVSAAKHTDTLRVQAALTARGGLRHSLLKKATVDSIEAAVGRVTAGYAEPSDSGIYLEYHTGFIEAWRVSSRGARLCQVPVAASFTLGAGSFLYVGEDVMLAQLQRWEDALAPQLQSLLDGKGGGHLIRYRIPKNERAWFSGPASKYLYLIVVDPRFAVAHAPTLNIPHGASVELFSGVNSPQGGLWVDCGVADYRLPQPPDSCKI